VIVGTVAFGLFLDALNMPLNVIGAARGILPKINFPHEALVLAGIAQILVNFVVKATLVVAVLGWFHVPVHLSSMLAIIPLAGLLVLGTAVGVLLVPIGALFQDVAHALVVVASGLVFLTPTAYAPPRVGLLGVITSWNPLTPLIMSARDLLVHGSSPAMPTTLILVAASIAALLLSWVMFRLAMPILIERMGS
jgi:lipopolysaccharide transport system permease protein